jgi:alcohol dehydrogenase
VQIAKAQGAEVIACASTPEKLEKLRALGADHLLDYSRDELHKWVWGKFGKPHRRDNSGGVDVVINFTGGDTWVPSLKCLRRQGRLLTCGATAGFDPVEDLRYIWTYELQIRGSNGWDRNDVESLLKMVAERKITPPIDHAFPLAESAAAMQRIEGRQTFGKVIVRPWQ